MATKFSDFAQLDVTTNQSFYVVGYSADNDNTAGTNVQTKHPINFNDYMSTTTHDASTSHKSLSIQSYYGLTDSNNKVTATASESQSYNPNTTTSFNNTTTTGYVDFMIRNKTSGAKFTATQYYFDSKTNDSASTAYTYDPLSTSTLNLENYTTTGYVDYAIKKKTSAAKFTITEFYASNSDNTQTASKTQNYDPLSTTTLDMDNYCTTGYVDYRFKNFKALPQGSNSAQVLITNKTSPYDAKWNNYGTIKVSGETGWSAKKFYDTYTVRNVTDEFLTYVPHFQTPTYHARIVYVGSYDANEGVKTGSTTKINDAASYYQYYDIDTKKIVTGNIQSTSNAVPGHIHFNIPKIGFFEGYNWNTKRRTGFINVVVDISGQDEEGHGWTTYDYYITAESEYSSNSYKGLGVIVQIPVHERTLTMNRTYSISVFHNNKDTVGSETCPTYFSFYLPPDNTRDKNYRIRHFTNNYTVGALRSSPQGTRESSIHFSEDGSKSIRKTQTPTTEFLISEIGTEEYSLYTTFNFMILNSSYSSIKTTNDTIVFDIIHKPKI
ncbi:MAG: hypothetical protein MJZ34_05320 [Paludibacteraceae bacterium]|nr:hypothetical protein [Paludibacteraceae bacterium]